MNRNIFFFFTFTTFVLSLTLHAQFECTDAVHPTDNQKSILSCCIRYIKQGNVVGYVKSGVPFETEAIAVNYDGKYYDMTNPEDLNELTQELFKQFPNGEETNERYELLRKKYSKATSSLAFGTVLAVLGGGMCIGGAVIMNNKMRNYSESNVNGQGAILFLLGAGGLGTGIPIAIVNGSKARKYKKEMEEIEMKTKLSFQATTNGIGLVLNF